MTELDRWQSAPHDLEAVANGEIHVWRAWLDLPAPALAPLLATLLPDERRKAARLCFTRDQQRFVAGRGLLRTILGCYTGMAPEQIRFCYGANGKPALVPLQQGDGWQFNVSHSHNVLLIAVGRGRQIGVDVERVRFVHNMERIIRQICSPREQAVLHDLPPDERCAAFFRCWTGKEAYAKACGDGLALPLAQIDVAPAREARSLRIGGSNNHGCWSLLPLAPTPGYEAALVTEGDGVRVRCWQWER